MGSTDLQRRAFLRGKKPKLESNAIRPPWTIEASQFVEACERCDECIKSCPEHILFRGDGGYPEVDFSKGGCTFCAKCVEVCDAGAFQSKESDNPRERSAEPCDAWDLQVLIKPNCLSLNAIVCRTCGDNCDEQAIQFRLQLGGVSIPEVDHEQCTGCGVCVYVCPEKSIAISLRDGS